MMPPTKEAVEGEPVEAAEIPVVAAEEAGPAVGEAEAVIVEIALSPNSMPR